VDQTYVQQPQRLQTSFIRNYMMVFGAISSIFDYATFLVMIYVFKAEASLFQTAWFVESIFTQTLVIFVIRTRAVPFFRSKPNKLLVINIAIILFMAIVLPFISLGSVFKFVPLPMTFLLVLLGFIMIYLGMVELVKIWFYKKFANGVRST
jgi:Mg2+-importing ATPase